LVLTVHFGLNLTKVILVTYPNSFSLEEAKSLVQSLSSVNCQIVKVVTQKYLNHSQYGLGSGKAEEIKQLVKESNADQIVIDEHLTSKQIHNLEKLTGAQVIDRERLILNIFYSRATTTEAKLQIELAEIKYEMPRIRENAKLASGILNLICFFLSLYVQKLWYYVTSRTIIATAALYCKAVW
jgi:GTP-binding protein HflX